MSELIETIETNVVPNDIPPDGGGNLRVKVDCPLINPSRTDRPSRLKKTSIQIVKRVNIH